MLFSNPINQSQLRSLCLWSGGNSRGQAWKQGGKRLRGEFCRDVAAQTGAAGRDQSERLQVSLQGKPSRSWLSIARPFRLREACTPTPPQPRHNPREDEVAFCHTGGCERLSRTPAVWILHFSHPAKATQQVRGEARDHLGCGREPVPQLLVHIFSTSPQFSNPLHSCCGLDLKSNLWTFAR